MPRFPEFEVKERVTAAVPEAAPIELGRGITPEEAASPITNYEGAPAFDRGLYERTVQLLTTNTLSNAFYANRKEMAEQTTSTLEAMRDQDPEFLAKALIFGRNEGLLQFAPMVGLAILSTAERKDLFRKAFDRVVQTPDNLREFVGLCKSGKFRTGFGGVATEAVKQWLTGLSEYQAIKYSGAAKSTQKDGQMVNNISLRDVVIMSRPKAADPEVNERLGFLVKTSNRPESYTYNKRIEQYEALKKANTDEERVRLIAAAQLPWEVVIPSVSKMTEPLWQALVRSMPYMALLRNINNLRKHGALNDEATVDYVASRLTDEQAIAKAKILPFRFFEAYRAYTDPERVQRRQIDRFIRPSEDEVEEGLVTSDSRITSALESALEKSFINLPDLPGTVAIASDISGSMDSTINDKGKTRFIDICGVFTGALNKKASGRVINLPFNHAVHQLEISADDRILTTTKKIVDACDGGTSLGLPVQLLLDRKQKVDAIIGITDNMDWAYDGDHRARGSFLNLWRSYRREVNPEAKAFLIRIDPYGAAAAPKDEPDVHFIYGWSDQVPGYIGQVMNGGANQVERVNQIEL